MRGSFGRIALAGAFLCALLSAWLNIRFLEMQKDRVEVLTVTREVEPYTAIPTDALRPAAVPRDAVPADAIADPAELAGSYTRALLIPGTVLRRSHLVTARGSNLAARLAAEPSQDVRAMALQVDDATGVAGTLREGDPVDVLVAIHADVTDPSREGDWSASGGTLARVIAQRVPVLYVQRNDMGGPAAVVLQVTPRTAEEIAFAQANGMIWLLTSPYGAEDEPVATTGVDRYVFFERYGIGGTEPPAPAQHAGVGPPVAMGEGAVAGSAIGGLVGGN